MVPGDESLGNGMIDDVDAIGMGVDDAEIGRPLSAPIPPPLTTGGLHDSGLEGNVCAWRRSVEMGGSAVTRAAKSGRATGTSGPGL